MVNKKSKVTLVGSVLAHEGAEFIYEGATELCHGCLLEKACNNLESGKLYRIIKVREVKHKCPVHYGGICAVDVEEAPVCALIPIDIAHKNTTITYKHLCSHEECEKFHLCHPPGIVAGQKYIITEIMEKDSDECREGIKLVLVELKPLPEELPRFIS